MWNGRYIATCKRQAVTIFIYFQFEMSANLNEIDQIIVTYVSSTGLKQYQYNTRDNTTDVIRGIKFANNIPLSDVTSDEISIQVAAVVNRAVNLPSDEFTSTQCGEAVDSTEIVAGRIVYIILKCV